MQITDIDTYTYQWSNFELVDIHRQSYWAFDLEATGIDFNVERVIQFGGVIFDHNALTVSTSFDQLVNPGRLIPDPIQKMTGITDEMVRGAPSFSEVFPRFVHQASNRIWITQAGYEFDCPMLLQECQRSRIDFPNVSILDTKALFAFMYPGRKEIHNTRFLVNFYNIRTEDLSRHDALGDALLIARIFQAQLAELKDRKQSHIVIEDPVYIKKSLPDITPPLNWSFIEPGIND